MRFQTAKEMLYPRSISASHTHLQTETRVRSLLAQKKPSECDFLKYRLIPTQAQTLWDWGSLLVGVGPLLCPALLCQSSVSCVEPRASQGPVRTGSGGFGTDKSWLTSTVSLKALASPQGPLCSSFLLWEYLLRTYCVPHDITIRTSLQHHNNFVHLVIL